MTDDEFVEFVQRNARRIADLLGNTPRVFGDPKRVVLKTQLFAGVLFNTIGGMIIVGVDCFFGHDVMLLTGTHDWRKFGADRVATFPSENYDIIVGDGAWIASGAIVLGPCKIGHHAVIAAGSVVRGDVEPFSLYAGNPAKKVADIAH